MRDKQLNRYKKLHQIWKKPFYAMAICIKPFSRDFILLKKYPYEPVQGNVETLYLVGFEDCEAKPIPFYVLSEKNFRKYFKKLKTKSLI